MASTLPSTLSSDHKYCPNATLCTPQDQLTRSNVTEMHYNLRMWLDQEDCFFPFSNNYYGCLDDLIFQENTNNFSIDSSSNSSYSIKEVPSFGTSAFGYYNSHSNSHTNSSGSTYYDELESNNNVYSTYAPSTNNDFVITPPQCWEYEGHTTTQVTGSENSNTKVGKYSAEEKRERILRYLKKRNQRNFRKTIKYACRKTLADRRVRIRGRFAKNHEDEIPTNYNHYRNIIQEDKSNNEMEQYGEFNKEWAQEAMSSLLYVPSISSCYSN